jgi:hypothetical protein
VLAAAILVLSAGALCADTRFTAGVTNIAAADQGGHIVAFSSQAVDANGKVLPQWQVKNLIDGKYVVGNYTPPDSYGWASSAPPTDANPQWIVFAFANDQTRLISRIAVDPTTDDPSFIGRWVKHFTFQVSNTTKDGPWKIVGDFDIVNKPIKQSFDFPPVEARYMRVLITANHGSDRCVEMGQFEAYEAIVGDDNLDQLIVRLENVLNDLKRYRDLTLAKQDRESREKASTKPPPPAGAVEKPAPTGDQTPTDNTPAGPAGPPK